MAPKLALIGTKASTKMSTINPMITQSQLTEFTGIPLRTVKRIALGLQKKEGNSIEKM